MRPEFSKFLTAVRNRIAFQEAHLEVEMELSRHLEDLVQESLGEGVAQEQAVQTALRKMGNAEEIGDRLNQVHTPKIPWVLVMIVTGMMALGIVNVVQSQQLGSHAVNILFGILAGVALYLLRPGRVAAAAPVFLILGFACLGLARIWGESYQGISYLKFLCFNINATEFSLAPFILGLGGLIGGKEQRPNLSALVSAAVVLALALSGSMYGAILVATAALAMMVAASFKTIPLLLSTLANAVTLGFFYNAQKFLSAEAFALARKTEAHTDFVLAHFHEQSTLLGALGIFLALAVVAQLATLLMQVRSRFARVIVVGHLSVLALGIVWSVLAGLGYVAMPSTGTPLPFISYGGSMLVGQMALMGMSVGLYWRRTLSLTLPEQR